MSIYKSQICVNVCRFRPNKIRKIHTLVTFLGWDVSFVIKFKPSFCCERISAFEAEFSAKYDLEKANKHYLEFSIWKKVNMIAWLYWVNELETSSFMKLLNPIMKCDSTGIQNLVEKYSEKLKNCPSIYHPKMALYSKK